MTQTKYWCFTSYAETLPTGPDPPPGIQYLIYQREVCPETNREHWQGYLELVSRQRLQGAKRALGDPAAHLEPRRGTSTQAADYCRKEESRKPDTEPTEIGNRTSATQGSRTDLLAVKQMLDAGASEAEIADAEFATWAKYFRGIERYKRITQPVRSWKTELFVLCGDTGTGKSRICMSKFPDAYWKPRGNWWDGYDGHEAVIIDDYYGWLPWDLLLRLTDRYPLTVETKGGSVNFVAKTIVITSNKTYNEWYKPEIDKSPLERRITKYSWTPLGSTTQEDMLERPGVGETNGTGT